ncbi:hypothetical protein BKA63DRAFT_137164 [Paraphoma chrysanthemicola]|nr:hypothetical protein BKA63DRAFT_137164 [Paraphoma chrysanthemicola]
MATSTAMNYSDMHFYPVMGHSDYSPVSEAFSYPEQYDTIDSLSYSNRDTAPGETTYSPLHRSPSHSASPLSPTANRWPNLRPTPYGALGEFCGGFNNPELSPLPTPGFGSPEHVLPVPACSPGYESISPRSLERGSPISDTSHQPSEGEVDAKPAPRKRGRPRLNRSSTGDGSSGSIGRRSQCLPHKQVERKYREGLNMEFERLRRAVPTLPQSMEANVMGAAKPSKGMVLAAAIDYIRRVEQERDAAMDEIERLGGHIRLGKLDVRVGGIRAA